MEELVVVVICLFLNALFAAYEMAFVSVPKSELRALARNGNRNAKKLLELRDNPEGTLSIIQVGITLVGAVAAAAGGAGATENLEPFLISQFGIGEGYAEGLSVLFVVMPLTFFSVVVGELVPKSLALRSPRKIVLAGSEVLFVLDRVLGFLVSIFEGSTQLVLGIFFKKQKKEINLAQESIEIDSFSPAHQRFMINMANIENKKVKDIFLTWDQVCHVQETDSVEEVARTVFSSGHTRLPVKRKGQIIGVLHTKEFMTLRESGETHWQNIIRPLLATKPTDSALGLLRQMQEKRSHLSVVFSATGECLGIVTLEDIIEEVVGDIFDEDDDDKVKKIFLTRTKDKISFSVDKKG